LDVAFVLLHLSTALTFILFILILRVRNKKALHYYFIFAVLAIFVWCVLFLVQQYMQPLDKNTGMFLNNCLSSNAVFLSVLLFFIGFVYSKSGSKINPKINFLFLIPLINTVLIWTNEYHHLIYFSYSADKGVFIQTLYGYIISFLNYGFIVLGLSYLLRFIVKNSGFFSRQSALIIVGALIPVAVDIALFSNIFTFPDCDLPV
jgi:two-component system sensor histidine kinase BarA